MIEIARLEVAMLDDVVAFRGEEVHLFAEASGGVFLTNKAVPLSSTRFNFIDQGGFGLRIGRHYGVDPFSTASVHQSCRSHLRCPPSSTVSSSPPCNGN